MTTENEQQDTVVAKPSSHLFLRLMVLLSFLLAAAALGASVYFWQLIQQSSHTQASEDQQLQQIQQQLSVTDEALDKQQDKLSLQQKVLNQLSAQTNQRDRTLVLAETEYLTRLASFSLHFEHNIPQAIQLLETANKRLVSLNDPTLMKIREVLTEKVTQLQAVPSPDISGILLKLNALGEQINKMPLVVSKAEDEDSDDTQGVKKANGDSAQTTQDAKPSVWRRSWNKTWGALKSVVVIKHQDESKIVAPTQRNYIDQHLQLLLAQAQWGLLRHQEQIYADSLKQAIKWVQQYYNLDAQQTKALLHSLNELEKVQVQPKVPDLGESIELIKQSLNKNVGQMKAADI